MGNFNTIHAVMTCPRCGVEIMAEVELRLGNTAMNLDLRVGDRYPWVLGKALNEGGRPEGGNADGDGYVECANCQKDSFVIVLIRADSVMGIAPNPAKAPYISD